MTSLPLTSTMLGIFTVCRLMEETRHYNVTLELEIDPAYGAAEVTRAVEALVAAQPALRVAFEENPTPHGVLRRIDEAPVAVECRTADAASYDAELDALHDRADAVSFDLARAPLARGLLLHAPHRSTLLLVVHHLVTDGMSIEPIVADLNALLLDPTAVEAVIERRERALVREHEAQTATSDDEAALSDWADRVRRTPSGPLHPAPERTSRSRLLGERRSHPLDAAESQRLADLCADLEATPFAFFTAVLAVTLARHTGEDGAVIGTPLMARRTAGSFELSGYFTNTLALPVTVDWDQSFADLLRGPVGDAVADVKRDARLSWPDVVKHLGEHGASYNNAGFSSMLAMQASTDVAPGQPVRSVRERGNGTVKLDLWLGATPRAEGWLLEVETDADLLPQPVADEIDLSLLSAVRSALTDPHRPVRELFQDASAGQAESDDGLSQGDPAPSLRAWSERVLTTGRDDHVMLSDANTQTTRSALRSRVDDLARGLRSRGIASGDTVAICTDGLTDSAALVLAILRVGARYLPLDPSLPARRLAFMTQRADCELVVGWDVPGIASVEVAELVSAGQSLADAELSVTRDDADADVYVMFTSGSTGEPKGVTMTDAPLRNLVDWQLAALHIGPETRFLQYAPMGFDVSFQEILPTLLAGGTVVSRGDVDRRDLAGILDLVAAERVTHVYLPVAALAAFCELAGERDLPDLSWVAVSGEQLVIGDRVRRFFQQRPGVRLMNLYGPTETHAVTTAVFDPEDAALWPRHAPIGRPIHGVRAWVVDRAGRLAPRGVPGELLLGGICPARGYANDPEQTRERFLPDPRGTDGARCYRTGDIVMWDADDVLVFLGRNDDQVKIRGHRIELAELELAAELVPGVEEAVAAVDDRGNEPALHLFVSTGDVVGDVPSLLAAVDRALIDRVPAPMRPRDVHLAPEIPRTANGKFDRTRLVAQTGQLASLRSHDLAGREVRVEDGLVGSLQRAWQAELGTNGVVDPDRSLFAMGAHSIMLLRHVTQLQHDLGVRIRLLDFFADPTLRTLSRLAEEGEAA